MNVAEQIAEICHLEGVHLLAGILGASAVPMVRALEKVPDRQVLYCRQERVAVDVCDGYARVTGEPGVVFADAGPGAANAMAGIVNSWGDSVPVLFFVPTEIRFETFSQRYSKELPVTDIFGPVSKWAVNLVDASQVDTVMRRAFMMLRAPRPGPVVIGLPRDLASSEGASPNYPPIGKLPRIGPEAGTIEAAVMALADAERPYVYVGAGVLTSGATDELLELAELFTLPVATTLNGKSAFPENHPLSLGIGGYAQATYSTLQAERTATEADVAFTVGCGFKRDAVIVPMPQETKLVQVDVDPGEFNNLYQADLPVLGDAKVVLQQMLEAAKAILPKERLQPRGAIIERVQSLKNRWLEICQPMLTSDQRPINPFRVTWEFSQLVKHDETIVLHDAGGTRGYVCQHYQATNPRGFIGYGVQSAMGWSLGAAMGAKVAAPEKLVVAFVGDEAFCETAMDIETSIVCDTPILVVLFNNREETLSRIDSMSGGGFNPLVGTVRWGGGKDLSAVAKALGAEACHVEDPAQIRPTLERAIRTVEGGRTTVVEFVVAREQHKLGSLFTKEAAGI